jgi:prepilin-type processing-associated H-X9-DG protein
VVIGIIALLISILLPALGKARAQANLIKCAANMHSLGLAMNIYLVNYKGTLPPGYWDGNPIGASTAVASPTPTDWGILLMSVLQKGGGLDWTSSATSGANQSGVRQVLFCPDGPPGTTNDPTGFFNLIQYTCHPRLMPEIYIGEPNDAMTGQPLLPYRVSHINNSSQIGLIFESSLEQAPNPAGMQFWIPHNTFPVTVNLDGGAITSATGGGLTISSTLAAGYLSQPVSINAGINVAYVNKDTSYNPNNIRFRHINNTACNVLFVDGHCQSFHYNARTKQTDMPRTMIYVNQ